MFWNYSEEARKILIQAKKEMKELKHPYVGSEHLMLAILKEENMISHRLKELGLDYQKFKDAVILQKIFNHSSQRITLMYIGVAQDEIDWSYKNFEL